MEIELPYLRIEDVEDMQPRVAIAYDINPGNKDKRIRVFGSQLLDDIVESTTLDNYYFGINAYYKQGAMLEKRFPDRISDISNACVMFWERMQQKLKQLRLNINDGI